MRRWRGGAIVLALLMALGGVLTQRQSEAGAVVRTVALPNDKHALALDRRHGRVFVANATAGTVSVLDAASGKLIRTVPAGHLAALAVDEQTQRVFGLSDDDATVRVLDASSGALLRAVPVGEYPNSIAVNASAGRVAVFSNALVPIVGILDATTGRLLHANEMDGVPANATMAVDETTARAFVYDDAENSVHIVDMRTGKTLRTALLGEGPVTFAVDDAAGRVLVARVGHIARARHGRFIDNGEVTIFDARTGRQLGAIPLRQGPRVLRRYFDLGSIGPNSPLIVLDRRRQRAFALDLAANTVTTIDVLHARATASVGLGAGPISFGIGGNPVEMALDEGEGRLFVATFGANGHGLLYTIDSASGRLLAATAVAPHPAALAVDSRRHRLYLAALGTIDTHLERPTGDGRLMVLDTRRGTVLHEIPLQGLPSSIALDEGAGRAFVTVSYDPALFARSPTQAGAWQWLPQWARARLPWLPAPPPNTAFGSVVVLDTTR